MIRFSAENGVLAYAKRPIPRGRPNERFLQNTLKNLDTGDLLPKQQERTLEYLYIYPSDS